MKKLIVFFTLLSISFASFAGNVEKERAKVLDTKTEIITRLYQENPETKNKIANAAGYATFSNVGVNVIFVSAGGGSGVVHNNASGKNTFMSMGSGGLGFGLGVKDFRAVFIFNTQKAMSDFTSNGWDFSGQADAAAKSGDKGGEGSVAKTAVKDVEIYQMTENGIALQATLQGTKYWKNDKLN